MEIRNFREIKTGWYSANINRKDCVCYKFNDGDNHYMNILTDHVMRIATSVQLTEGIIFTPVAFRRAEKDAFMFSPTKEMA